jgi:hypothetical protein
MTRGSRVFGCAWLTTGVWLSFLAVFACSGSVERTLGQDGCTVGDQRFDVGESFPAPDGCNTCQCTDEGVSCTLIGCVGGGGAGGKGGAASCEHGGRRYATGDSFPAADGCNTCTCFEDGSVVCTRLACGQSCLYEGASYPVGESFPAGDGCNTCSCEAGGVVGCTFVLCLGCTYEGQTYPPGASFPSLDGCNTCSCYDGGAVGCTTMACLCDPQIEWYRQYVASSAATCNIIDFGCPENTTLFSNVCGCGCQQDASCPRWFDCMPPTPCDPVELKRKCPYSGIAY